jgi:hypothetical protein
MIALPKWLTDIKKLFGTADGKVLGRVGGAWAFLSSFVPSAHKSTHATGGSDALSPSDIGAAATDHNHDSEYAAIASEHTHTNKSTLDKVSEAGGLPTWNGEAWPGGGCPDYILQGRGLI